MIIKNLTRKGGGSGQLLRYIFRYTFRDQHVPVREGTTYRDALLRLNIKFTDNDLRYLEAERIDAQIMKDYAAAGNDFKTFWEQQLEREQLPAAFIIKHNVLANSIEGFVKEFRENEAGRIHKRADQTSVHHTILSWSNKDKERVTDTMLRDMAKQYIQARGPQCKFVGTVHKDKDHIHLHLVMSGTTLNGRSSRISKQEFHEVKQKVQAYQKEKYPELAHSLPEHGKGRRVELTKEERKIIKFDERASVKTILLRCLEATEHTSAKQLFTALQAQGFTTYSRGGSITGVQHESGLKFRFSRLPIDISKLLEADRKTTIQEKEMEALSKLRQSKGRTSRQQQVKKEEKELSNNKDLEELSAIRAGGRSRELESKEQERDEPEFERSLSTDKAVDHPDEVDDTQDTDTQDYETDETDYYEEP